MAEQPDSGHKAPHTLLLFLRTQSQNSLTRLYASPSACLAILRLLRPLERHIVMCLLWLEGSVAVNTLPSWVHPNKSARDQYESAIESLTDLHVIAKPSLDSNAAPLSKLTLNPSFKSGLRTAIIGGGDHKSFGIPCEKDDKRQSIESLDSYALERWETMLHFMVSSGTDKVGVVPSRGVLLLLQAGSLMTAASNGAPLKITSLGFQFLLDTPHAQLWTILIHYLRFSEDRMDIIDVLSFLFMLSTMELGQNYLIENGNPAQEAMLEDLRALGLVWQRKSKSKRFHPTRLATTLTSSSPPLPTPMQTHAPSGNSGISTASGGPTQGFIILETNYRLYAYTDNPLQIAVLNLFASLRSRFPNLVVGVLSRDSVKRALANGITANQIISYLTTHAHPQMAKNNPILPSTVQDQIKLWEHERKRVTTAEGVLYADFASQSDYDELLKYARDMESVLWENASIRKFVGTPEAHESVKSFISKRQQQSYSGQY